MACDTQTLKGQTPVQRKQEVREAIARLNAGLLKGKIKAVVSPKGAITFAGWQETDRGRVSDACAYRHLMISGSALVKAEVAKAEKIAGRGVDRQVVASGVHSHDGGNTWHHGH